MDRLRSAMVADEAILWAMLYEAAHMAEDGAAGPEVAQQDPYLSIYVAGWGRNSDIGVIAEAADGTATGAAWARLPDQAYCLPGVPSDMPEVAIGVLPAYTGRGIGGALLAQLISIATGRFPGLALSVRANNPAQRLYERHGFAVIGELSNRVGTRSLVMVRRLSLSKVDK